MDFNPKKSFNCIIDLLNRCEQLERRIDNLILNNGVLQLSIEEPIIKGMHLCLRCNCELIPKINILCLGCQAIVKETADKNQDLFESMCKEVYSVPKWQYKTKGTFKLPQQSQHSLFLKQEIFAALQSQGLVFYDDLYYQEKLCPKSANSVLFESEFFQKMSLADYETFLRFKMLTNQCLYLPVALERDKVQGYRVRAQCDIPQYTLISEYTGNVMFEYQLTSKDRQNDSIMLLLKRTGELRKSLLICPRTCGNLAKFLLGVNNQEEDKEKVQNVSSIRYDINGCAHVLLYTYKRVRKGTLLYYDYNEGGEKGYNTAHFIHTK